MLIVKCPHCGDTSGYYRNASVSGKVEFHYTFDGKVDEQGALHDKVVYKEQKKCFCQNCDQELVGYKPVVII